MKDNRAIILFVVYLMIATTLAVLGVSNNTVSFVSIMGVVIIMNIANIVKTLLRKESKLMKKLPIELLSITLCCIGITIMIYSANLWIDIIITLVIIILNVKIVKLLGAKADETNSNSQTE